MINAALNEHYRLARLGKPKVIRDEKYQPDHVQRKLKGHMIKPWYALV